MKTRPIISQLLDLLQDETRLAIFIHLLVYKTLTLKQLSEYINKGKTTIHHHIRIFEKINIIDWDEKEEDRRKLKTRHYSISNILSQEIRKKNSTIYKMELDRLISSKISKLMVEYSKNRSDLNMDEYRIPPILSIPLTIETLKLYEEFFSKISQLYAQKELNYEDESPITHLVSHIFIPIREILDWKYQQNTDVE